MAEATSTGLVTVVCANHHQILISGLLRLFQSKQKVDCDLRWGGRVVKVHRLLLDVLLSPGKLGVVKQEVDPDQSDRNSLDLMVDFLYQGRISVHHDELPGLLQVAKDCKFYMLVGAVQAAIKREQVKVQAAKTAEMRRLASTNALTLLDGRESREILGTDAIGNPQTGKPEAVSSVAGSPDPDSVDISDFEDLDLVVDEGVEEEENDHEVQVDDQDDHLQVTPTVELTELHKCKVCRKVFMFEKDFERHHDACLPFRSERFLDSKPVDHNPADFRYNLERPLKSATVVTQLRQRSDSGDKLHKCGRCPKKFDRLQSLVIHERTHDGVPPFKCELCPRAFTSLHGKTNHQSNHTKYMSHDCSLCDRKFVDGRQLAEHLRDHDGDARFECRFCDKTYADARHKARHEGTHSGQRYFYCHECPRRFPSNYRLSIHLRSHISPGLRPYICEKCGRSFLKVNHLNSHLKSHSEIKTYNCQICPNKSYKSAQSLQAHSFTHRQEKPHKCSYCSSAFHMRGNLTVHLNNVHGKSIPIKSRKFHINPRNHVSNTVNEKNK